MDDTMDALVPPRELVDFVGGSDFRVMGAHLLRLLIAVGGLRTTDRVLDVGCGSGRVAVSLMRYLTTGTYDGFDVGQAAIEWCQREITARDTRFRFQFADVANGVYNAAGKTAAAEYRFSYDDAFDFIFLTSVFTHMLPHELDRYLSEIARVLAPGGRVCATFFLSIEEAREAMEAGRAVHNFSVVREGYRASNPTVMETAVAYDEVSVRARYARHGFKIIEPIHFGTWTGRVSGETHQDVIVAEIAPEGFEGLADLEVLRIALAEARSRIDDLEMKQYQAEMSLWEAKKRIWELETRGRETN